MPLDILQPSINPQRRSVRRQVVLIGQTGPAEIDISAFVRAEVDLQCTYSASLREHTRALELLERRDIDPDRVINRWESIYDADELVEEVAAGNFCKPVFDFYGRSVKTRTSLQRPGVSVEPPGSERHPEGLPPNG